MDFSNNVTILKDCSDFELHEERVCDDIEEAFPFLQYAVNCVFYHADNSEENGITQKELLETFPLPQWIWLNNIYQHMSRKVTEHATFMYILAEVNIANLIKIHPLAS